MGGLPPLAFMVGHYLGYKIKDAAGSSEPVTQEQHAARLMGGLMGM